ncbi:MAG: hypothetical protein MJ072_07160, partial [Clostridia bacterium]|nr:hypothetical protein [Clostridia bacterium]
MYFDAFSRNVNQVIDLATTLAKKFECKYVGTEHILFGLLNAQDGRAAAILKQAEVDKDRYLYYFQKTIDYTVNNTGNMFTAKTKQLFEKAIEVSLKAHSGFVGTEHLLVALLLDDECTAVSILRVMHVDVDTLAEELATSLIAGIEESVEDEPDENE